MKIVFGWHLDGPTWPETPDGGAFVLDAAVVGPLGLLNLLETRLGVNAPDRPAALRIAQYLARLRVTDDGEAFFSRSLAADGWATARLLLRWRDGLIAAGWCPRSKSWVAERLRRLAVVEEEESDPLVPGIPDRAAALIPMIRAPSPIDELVLVDRIERLPFVWRRLIEALVLAGTAIAHKTLPIRRNGAAVAEGRAVERSSVGGNQSRPNSDLAIVQAMLTNRQPGRLQGDGSFAVAHCDDELMAADIAAEWLAAVPEANDGVVIVRQGDGTVLDAACHRLGLPRPGGNERSPFRGALQILPLAFETAWQPLDPKRMLELLMMQASPIPHEAGRLFAGVLRDYPGTGGARWRAVWDKAAIQLRDNLQESDLDEDECDRQVRKTIANWREWLEPERHERNVGVPAKAADAICRKVQRWAIRRASIAENSIYMDLVNAVTALTATIAASGLDSITKPQLDRMIDAVVADGIARPGTVEEAAPWALVDNPAQVWDEARAVLWYGFSDPGSAVSGLPWTAYERDELAAAKVELVSSEAVAALWLDAQRRAILGATKSVLLVEHALTAAQMSTRHPIWHELADLDGLNRAIIEARPLRNSDRALLCGRRWKTNPIESHALPGPIRNWFVTEDRIGPRSSESASSLENLLGCPLNWVLQYQSGLRAAGLLDMAEGNRLKGNVAHEVLARFFAGQVPDNPDEIRAAVAALLEAMLPQIGSPLLLPGQLREREDMRRNTIESAVVLARILKSQKIAVVATERELACPLDEECELRGIVDLELAAEDGQPAVVDLKWSERARYRLQEITEGRAVQLAVYARLLWDGEAFEFPAGGYFMLKQQWLLAVDAEPFPPEFRIQGNDLASVWNDLMIARDEAFDDLATGRVIATGVEFEDEQSVAGGNLLDPPCRFCCFGRLCGYRALQ